MPEEANVCGWKALGRVLADLSMDRPQTAARGAAESCVRPV